MTIKDVIKWCDDQSQAGHEIVIGWDGGGDSGWVFLEVDGQQVHAEEAEWLVNKMCDELDYGSWAGEFSAAGSAVYDPETKTFEGEDVYSEDESASLDLSEDSIIEIKIPKKYFFETLTLDLDNILDGGNVDLRPRVSNGMMNAELIDYCDELEQSICDKAVELLGNHTKSEYSGWQSETWNAEDVKEAATKDPDFYVFELKNLEYMTYNEEVRGMAIDLNEWAEILNDQEI